MRASSEPVRKRPVNLTLSESLVAEAKIYTANLSATVEILLARYIVDQQQVRRARQQAADICADDWNALHEAIGSFADSHSTL